MNFHFYQKIGILLNSNKLRQKLTNINVYQRNSQVSITLKHVNFQPKHLKNHQKKSMTKTHKFSQNTEIVKKLFLKHFNFINFEYFEILVLKNQYSENIF